LTKGDENKIRNKRISSFGPKTLNELINNKNNSEALDNISKNIIYNKK